MSLLFEPLTLRALTVPNRVWLPPLCMYSATDGMPDDWHLMHYGARAAGGFGLLIAEATAVAPEGRISPQDTGLWSDDQIPAWARVVDLVHACGARMAVQLAHAGRKASVYRPWEPVQGSVPPENGGWLTHAPSPLDFPGYAAPAEMTGDQIAAVPRMFADAAVRARTAGFDAVELHAAHGYLLHQFLSPLSNERTDSYGGPMENRIRLLRETVEAVRAVWPQELPVFVRVSATDWLDGGLTVEDLTAVAKELQTLGVDLMDVSTGALLPAPIPVGPGYQVPFAAHIRSGAGMATAVAGMITSPAQAEQVLAEGSADVVLLGRAGLGDPNWPLRAAAGLGVAHGTAPAGSGVGILPQHASAFYG